MADEQHSIRSVVWQDVFPFTLIFRSFRVAVQPSKLILALIALLSIYTVGRVLDRVWPGNHRAVPGEISMYLQSTRGDVRVAPEWGKFDFNDIPGGNPLLNSGLELRSAADGTGAKGGADAFDAARKSTMDRLAARHQSRLNEIGKPSGSLADLKYKIIVDRDKAVAAANDAFAKSDKSKPVVNERQRDAVIQAAYRRASAQWTEDKQIDNVGLFDTLFNYEIEQVNGVVYSVLSGNWIAVPSAVVNFFMTGPSWALRHHSVFFFLFALLFLTIWALFGGAISRIAAVQVARDEKISIRQAVRYSGDKFVSYFSAPLIPLVMIGVLGGLIYLGGLLGNIPVVGPIVVAALFVVGLILAAIVTLVLLGFGGGFPMMYPTIAAEGSDAFDAISRSFSYLYAKPWRMAFYSFVAIVYGALCYLFVRFFLFVLLATAHYFAGAGVYLHAGDNTDLWTNLWPGPTSGASLVYDIDFINLNWWQDVAALLLSFWVYTTIAILGAFAISFYFSASTTIYFLMRQEVDAIELDDVYLEQSEEDLDVNDSVEAEPLAAAPAPEAPVTPPTSDTGPAPAV